MEMKLSGVEVLRDEWGKARRDLVYESIDAV